MTYNRKCESENHRAGPGRALLTLCLVGSLSLVPLACMPSSADSQSEQTATDEEAASAESATYEVPAYSGERSVQQRLNDASVAAQVKRALVRQRALRVFDFNPTVEGKTVTLRGDVNTKAQWERADEITRRIATGREVVNAVTVGGRPADEVDDSATEETGASTAVYHTVERGENLWGIARQYGASVQRLRSLNNMSSGGLRAGERIRVR